MVVQFDDESVHHWCLLVNGSLHGFVKWLDCGSLGGLLQYVISRELYLSVTSGFTRQEEHILMFYVENYSPHMVTHLTLQPPNHVICLVNWELIASLLRRMSPERQIKFVRRSKYLTYEGEDIAAPVIPPSEPLFIIDTHFHLDLVVKRLRFYYGIANYVFPNNWSDWKTHIGHAKAVYVIFGIHPHVTSRGLSSHRAQALQALL